jgi:hypothetical protein
MSAKHGKRNGSERTKADTQALHIKLDRRILAALKRESEARGGRQERRITEEALTVYLGLKVLSQTNGFAGLPRIATRASNGYKYSRIVEKRGISRRLPSPRCHLQSAICTGEQISF